MEDLFVYATGLRHVEFWSPILRSLFSTRGPSQVHAIIASAREERRIRNHLDQNSITVGSVECVDYLDLLALKSNPCPEKIIEWESITKKSIHAIVKSDRILGRKFHKPNCRRPNVNILQNNPDPSAAAIFYLDHFRSRLAQTAPSAVLMTAVASLPALALCLAAESLGIDYFVLRPLRIGSRYVFVKNSTEDKLLNSTDQETRSQDHVQPQQIQSLLDDFLGPFRAGAWVPPDWATLGSRDSALKELKRSSLRMTRLLTRFPKVARICICGSSLKYPSRASSVFDTWLHEFRVEASRIASFRTRSATPPPPGNFVYFPLHVDPEASTAVLAPIYLSQLALAEIVAGGLPRGAYLCIKEHPRMWGLRDRHFQRRLRSIPNAYLADPETPSERLIRESLAVLTISGTAGWEAVLMGKPVVNFSNCFYNELQLSVRCTSLENIFLDIEEAIEISDSKNQQERLTIIESALRKSLQYSFEAPMGSLWSGFNHEHQLSADAADLAARILNEFLAGAS